MEDLNAAKRREEVEEARLENQDPLQRSWKAIIQELIKSYEGTFARKEYQFLGVIYAVAQFVEVCFRKQETFTTEQMNERIRELAQIFCFHVPDPINADTNEIFYKRLEEFIFGTLFYFQKMEGDEDAIHFQRLSEWLPAVLHAVVPSFAPPYSKEKDCRTAELYCQIHQEERVEKLHVLHRVGCALAIFVECHSLENTELGNLGLLPEEQLAAIRVGILQGRYRELKATLLKVEKLSPKLNALLEEEEALCIKLLGEDAHAGEDGHAALPHECAREILQIFDELLANDKASVLNDYMPNCEIIANPDELLSVIIRRDYYPDLAGVEQAPPITQSMRILDHQFRAEEEKERERLLGDNGTLNPERLHRTLLGLAVEEQLQMLENMHNEIIFNEKGKYAKPKKKLFGKKEEPYNANQLNHIRILQDTYLEIISANRNKKTLKAVTESTLLDFTAEMVDFTPKEKALQLLTEPAAQVVVQNSNIDVAQNLSAGLTKGK